MSDTKSILGKIRSLHCRSHCVYHCVCHCVCLHSTHTHPFSVHLVPYHSVPCPVCSKLTPTWYINDHLDRDCSQLHKQDEQKEGQNPSNEQQSSSPLKHTPLKQPPLPSPQQPISSKQDNVRCICKHSAKLT